MEKAGVGKTIRAFLDCMVYLHYRSFEEIDLPPFLEAENLSIIVPRITLRELDKNKNTNSSSRIRERARKILRKIEKWAEEGAIRPGMSLGIYPKTPTIDYAQYDLNPEWNDDVLIASILQYKLDYPEEDPVLITQDSGPKFTAEHLGIRVFQLPEKYKLPVEQDPLQKENQELKKTLARLQSALPQIIVCFVGQEEPQPYARFVLSPPPKPMDQQIKQTIKELRENFPKLYPPKQKAAEKGMATCDLAELSKLVDLVGLVDPILPTEYERYNKGIDKFLADYEKYMRDTWEIKTLLMRGIRFQIEIRNIGTSPADDNDVEFHFPDGFQLLDKDDLPISPKEPIPPDEPRTSKQILADSFRQAIRIPEHIFPVSNFNVLKSLSTFKIKRDNSYTVTDHFKRIKHGDYDVLPEMYIIFNSYESASSFSCDFMIRIANLPEPIIGQLHFVIEKDEKQNHN